MNKFTVHVRDKRRLTGAKAWVTGGESVSTIMMLKGGENGRR